MAADEVLGRALFGMALLSLGVIGSLGVIAVVCALPGAGPKRRRFLQLAGGEFYRQWPRAFSVYVATAGLCVVAGAVAEMIVYVSWTVGAISVPWWGPAVPAAFIGMPIACVAVTALAGRLRL